MFSDEVPHLNSRWLLAHPLWLASALLVCCGSASFAQPVVRTSFAGETMGTTYSIVIAGSFTDEEKTDLQTRIDSRLEEIDSAMSTWRDDSELSKFNRAQTTDWFDVSNDTAIVVSAALRIAELSGGAFDPTVGPLVRLWNFSKEKRDTLNPPSDEEIAQLLSNLGYQRIEVRLQPPALRKNSPAVELDLSAIAKGFAVDAISQLLIEQDRTQHLVEIGGEMKAAGRKQDGSSWAAGIEKPTELRRGDIHTILALDDAALATSGDYRNYYEINGQRFSHTIDPTRGRPISHKLASVSIVADDCMTADAWATAINVLGPDAGLKAAEENNLAAMLLVREGTGFVEKRTLGFERLVTPFVAHQKHEGLSPFGTVIAALIVFAVAITGMAVGVIFSNRRIQGSCGGLSNMPGQEGSACDLCSTPEEECPEKMALANAQAGDTQAVGDNGQTNQSAEDKTGPNSGPTKKFSV